MTKETKIENVKASQNFPNIALSIRENPASKMWEIVTIRYNVEAKASFIESVEEVSENRLGAIERFKIRLVQLGLV